MAVLLGRWLCLPAVHLLTDESDKGSVDALCAYPPYDYSTGLPF